MKFLHLSDLHFGKSIHGVSLLESGDQLTWVGRFLNLVRETAPDAVVIAGDVYDRSAPSGDAMALLDGLLTTLANLKIPVLLIAGNHDSGQRLAFGGSLLARQQIHIAGVLSKELTHVTLSDDHGPVTFWLMPYVFPALVGQVLEDSTLRDYESAIRQLLAHQPIDFTQRNVLVAHQNVTCNGRESQRGGSESMVGGVGQVDYTAFDGFDYVALGHIHAAYAVGRPEVRYAGSPLCYHFDETKQPTKGPILVELGPKGTPPVLRTLPIEPLHPMEELRGPAQVLRDTLLEGSIRGKYLRLVLTDQRVTPELSALFHGICEQKDCLLMELVSEFRPFSPAAPTQNVQAEATVEERFLQFYAARSGGAEADDPERALLQFAGEQVRTPNRFGENQLPTQEAIDALIQFALEQEAQP